MLAALQCSSSFRVAEVLFFSATLTAGFRLAASRSILDYVSSKPLAAGPPSPVLTSSSGGSRASRHEMDFTENKLQHQTSTPKKMELQYLREITKQFSEDLILGDGGFGIVYKGEKTDGKLVAVKKLKDMQGDDKQFVNEVKHVMDIYHPNIVRLEGYCYHIEREVMCHNGSNVLVDKVYRLLCFEYLPNGSLDKHLADESSGLDWHERYNIIMGVCNGLHCLHEGRRGEPILHLDLKPANVLLDEKMIPKIADFGQSRLFSEGKTHSHTMNVVGSIGYMAPEYIDSGMLTKESDIYSLGVIIMEIVTGHRKYPENTTADEFTEIRGKWRRRLQTTLNKAWMVESCHQVNLCIGIARQCMERDPKRRPNIKDIVGNLGAQKIRNPTEVKEDRFMQLHSSEEPLLEERAGLLQRPKAAKKSQPPGMVKCSNKTTNKRKWLDMLDLGVLISTFAMFVFMCVFVSAYVFVGRISITVENASLNRFALATSPARELAYNLSLTLSIHNPNWAMDMKNTEPLEVACFFDSHRFDHKQIAEKGDVHPAGKTRVYSLDMSSESGYVPLGKAGMVEYKKENAMGVFEVEVVLTGQVQFTPRNAKCKLEAICPLKLQLAQPVAGTTALAFHKVKCKVSQPEKNC